MINFGGNNNFKDNEFIYKEWSAPVYVTSKAIRKDFKGFAFNEKGQRKIIKNIRIVGACYNLDLFDLASDLYKQFENTGNLESFPYKADNWLEKVDDLERLDESFEINRLIEIDEPIIFEFTDGSTLEVDYSDGGCLRMSENKIPINIGCGINQANFDGNVIFSPLLGRNISELYIETSTYADYCGSYGYLPDLEEYISSVSFEFSYKDDHDNYRLTFCNAMDYGLVYLSKNNNMDKINIKEFIKGYIKEKNRTK